MPVKTNYPMFDSIANNARKELVPLSGVFELTPRCTLDCKMCYVHLTEEQMCGRKELPTEKWIQIIDEAIEEGMLFALLTGGECMMHKGFREIYLHLREKGIITTVNTNGTLLNEDNINFFVKYPPNRIKITLYGTSDDGYEKVTGHRQFTRVRDSILKLNELGLPLKLAITICKHCYDEAGDIVKFAIDNKIPYNVDMAMFQASDETGRVVDDYGLTPEETAAKYREIAILEGRRIYDNEPITELPEIMDDSVKAKALRCGAGRSTFTAKWDGRLMPCLWIDNDAPSILEDSFHDAWKKANKIADEYTIPVECVKCPYSGVCYGCAAYRADPKNPAHCNLQVCATTIAKINAGIYGKAALKKETE